MRSPLGTGRVVMDRTAFVVMRAWKPVTSTQLAVAVPERAAPDGDAAV